MIENPTDASKAHPIYQWNRAHDWDLTLCYGSFNEATISSPIWSMFLPLRLFEDADLIFIYSQVDHSDRRNRSDPCRNRPEPAGSFMFLHVPCNRIPAGFSTDEFRRIFCRFRLECAGTDRNSFVEKPAGIRLQGTWRSIKDPAGSDRVRTTWARRRQHCYELAASFSNIFLKATK